MPRENRYSRSNVQIAAPRSAPVQTQVAAGRAVQINNQYSELEGLRDRLGNFLGRVNNSIDVATAARARSLQDVDENLADEAFTDFAMGRAITDVDERKRTNKSYVKAYQTLSAGKNALELATEFKAHVANWTPADGPLTEVRDRFMQENLQGADQLGHVYNRAFVTRFISATDGIVAKGGELAAAEVQRTGRINFLAKSSGLINDSDNPITVEDFQELDAELDGLTALDERSRIATLFSTMKNAAAAGSPDARLRFLRATESLPLNDNGQTFAQLFPKEHARYAEALNEENYTAQAAGAQEAFAAITDQAQELALAGDWQTVEDELYPQYLATIDRYGDGPHAAAVKERLNSLLTHMGEQAVVAHAVAEEMRGVNTGMTTKELNDNAIAYVKRQGYDLNANSPSGELQQRAIGTGTVLSQLYLGRGEVPESLIKPIEGMLGAGKAASVDHQLAALSALRRADKLSNGGVATMLKDNSYAASVWDMMKGVDDDEAQRMFSAMNEHPEVFTRALTAPLWEVMGITPKSTDRADVKKAEQEALADLDSSDILKALGADGIDELDWNGAVGQLVQKRMRFRYGMATATGTPVSDHDAIAVAAAESVRDDVIVTPVSYNSGGFDFFGDDTKWRIDVKSTVETLPPDPGFMNIRDELQAGVPGTAESLRDNIEADLDAASGIAKDVSFSVHQGEWADANFFTVRIGDGETGIPHDVRFSAQPGMSSTLFGKELEFTGNPNEDAQTFRKVADELGLPAGFELMPVRRSVRNGRPGQYMLAYRPTFRDPRAKENKSLEERGREWDERRSRQGQAQVNASIDRYRASLQASGEVRPSVGLTNFSMDEVLAQGPLAGLHKLLTEQRLNPNPPPMKARTETAETAKFIRDNEGIPHATSYDDQGDRSIGYGFNLTRNKQLFLDTLGATEEEYQDALDGDLALTPQQIASLHEAAVSQFETQVDRWYKDVDLRAHERKAIVSLAFNNPSMISPKTRFFKAVKEGDREAAIKEILYRSNATKLPGLFTRRYSEALMFAGDASLVPTQSEYKAQVGI